MASNKTNVIFTSIMASNKTNVIFTLHYYGDDYYANFLQVHSILVVQIDIYKNLAISKQYQF